MDHVVESGEPDEIETAVENLGEVDATINHLGGSSIQLGLLVMRPGDTMVVCGRTASDRSKIDVPELYFGHKHVVGDMLGTQQDLVTLVSLLNEERFEPAIADEYPLAGLATAISDMDNRDLFGKSLVHP